MPLRHFRSFFSLIGLLPLLWSCSPSSNSISHTAASQQDGQRLSTEQDVATANNANSDASAIAPNDASNLETTPYFVTPSGKIICLAATDTLRCELTTGETLKPLPTRPADCDLDWGSGVVLDQNGVSVLCAGDTIQTAASESLTTLPYGELWESGDFNCTVEPTGLTCNNYQGEGFFLSTQEWRPFLSSFFEFDQIRNERFGFALVTPLPWDVDPSQNGDGVLIQSPNNDLIISAYGERADGSLSELIAQHRQELSSLPSDAAVNINSETDITVPIEGSDQAATGWRVDYTQSKIDQDAWQPYRVIETVVVHEGLSYHLSLQIAEPAFDEFYLGIVQTINQAFTILANNAE